MPDRHAIQFVAGCPQKGFLGVTGNQLASGRDITSFRRSVNGVLAYSFSSVYQSSCGEYWPHQRHAVHSQRWLQPGHRPRVSKVFHSVPQPRKYSGGPPSPQNHRLFEFGCHLHCGQRMRLNFDSSLISCKAFSILSVGMLPWRKSANASVSLTNLRKDFWLGNIFSLRTKQGYKAG